ncbi:hypothetical protein [Solilutibacter silvestris]|uniref:hypothetical protein n=1 Tax=Solilutibacter silvestris TaxID=1645665 RepID=UPI003D337501
MFKSLRFPLAYVLEVVLLVPLFASFCLVTAFIASHSSSSLRATEARIPSNWEAAVPNHGGYLRGFSITAHPALFALSIAVFLVVGALSWQLRVAQSWQRRNVPPAQARTYAIAAAVTFVAWVAIALFLFTQVLPKLAAA